VRSAGVIVHDGFWLPAGIRDKVLRGATWDTIWLSGGTLVDAEAPGAVAIRAPRLAIESWRDLLAGLDVARAAAPRPRETAARWQAALRAVLGYLGSSAETVLPVLAAATGYSAPMLAAALAHGDLVSPNGLAEACRFRPAWSVASRWERMPDLAGWVRFFPARPVDRAGVVLRSRRPLTRTAPPAQFVLGYAAGNVPGTALLISLLAGMANYAHQDDAPPAVLVRNSRHEPLFAPWVLSAVEAVDPELVASTAVMLWDYNEAELQGHLLRGADLMVAAAGDEAIAALDALRARHAPACRFHRHGHKVSFVCIAGPTPDAARLAALDSSLWDQNGCLSARVHFVEEDAEAYAGELTAAMRALAGELTPLRAPCFRRLCRAASGWQGGVRLLDVRGRFRSDSGSPGVES
jgi:hypothetical protein